MFRGGFRGHAGAVLIRMDFRGIARSPEVSMNVEKSQRLYNAYLAAEAYRETHGVDTADRANVRPSETSEPSSEETACGYIVVGIDGSDVSRRALHWAADEAMHRGLHLMVCRAWEPHSTMVLTPHRSHDDGSSVGERTESEVLTDIANVVSNLPAPIDVTPVVVGGDPQKLLDEYVEGASIVVLGDSHRGRALPQLTSVVRHVVTRARCPVILVP